MVPIKGSEVRPQNHNHDSRHYLYSPEFSTPIDSYSSLSAVRWFEAAENPKVGEAEQKRQYTAGLVKDMEYQLQAVVKHINLGLNSARSFNIAKQAAIQ